MRLPTFISIGFVVVVAMSVAHAGVLPGVFDLGVILWPPNQLNVQPYRIEIFSEQNIVRATPETYQGPVEEFWYDEASGEGLKTVNALLVAVEVEESNPSVRFTEYVHTGAIFLPDWIATTTPPGIITGGITVEGIPVEITIDQNVSPWLVTETGFGPWPLQAPVFAQSNYAPFSFGDTLYAVEPNSGSIDSGAGTFQVHKWMRFEDSETNGIYIAPAVPSNAAYPLISEVQVAGSLTGTTTVAANDFIELYNPTNAPMSLGGWKLRKQTASSTESSLAVFSASSTIPAYGYFLWANSTNGYGASIGADAVNGNSIASNNGIALLNANDTLIDRVGWGLFGGSFVEGSAITAELQASQSYERNMWQGIRCFSAQGMGEFLGNGCDTNNNNTDFEVRAVSNPQNTASTPEP